MRHGTKPALSEDEARELRIERRSIHTPKGNVINIFYNPERNLLVVDVCGDSGGNEILRTQLNESALLAHLND